MSSTYQEKDELCHEAPAATDDPWWQESVVLTFWDDQAGVGALFRLGHEVGQGTATVWLGAVTDAGDRYRWYRGALPLSDHDRAGDGVRLEAGGVAAVLENGQLHWRVSQPEFECDVTVTDFYPMTNLWQLGTQTSLAKEFAPEHWEASGRVTGTVRIGDRRYDVDGLHHRDHSWGTRKWNTIRTHRWVAGTLGPDLSFMGLSWLANDGSLVTEGYVNRHGETTPARAVDILAYVDIDGLSCRGGRVRMDLPDGTDVTFEADRVDGLLTLHRNVACVDTISRVRLADGRTGFCDFETTHNSRGGEEAVTVMVGAAIDDGLSHR
ncbi:MAG: DUF7064 domain-containing protein [Acidimicrobiia bacterium]